MTHEITTREEGMKFGAVFADTGFVRIVIAPHGDAVLHMNGHDARVIDRMESRKKGGHEVYITNLDDLKTLHAVLGEAIEAREAMSVLEEHVEVVKVPEMSPLDSPSAQEAVEIAVREAVKRGDYEEAMNIYDRAHEMGVITK